MPAHPMSQHPHRPDHAPYAHCLHGCPIETTLTVLSGKWKGMVLHRLLDRTLRFGELKRLLPVTQKMLTRQLRELERDGVIQRTVYAEVPPRVEYSLTPFGLSLKPILLMMNEWGQQYHHQIASAARETSHDGHGARSAVR
jgi:DNA-binding HxlR family transcriptional regulator